MTSEFRLRTFVTADGHPVCCHSMAARGAGKPRGTVLLVHGFGQNLLTWHSEHRSFCRFLAESGWQVEAVELRGHGESGRLGSPFATGLGDYLVKDLPCLVSGLQEAPTAECELPRPVVAIGHSLGGLMACWLGRTFPRRFAGIATIASPGRMHLFPLLAAVRAVRNAGRRLPGGEERLRSWPFHLDWAGRFTAAVVRLGLERRIPQMSRPWTSGSMEDSMMVERTTVGFDRTGLGLTLELVRWAETGKLAIEGVSEDLVSTFADIRQPLLLVSSSGDRVIPRSVALLPSRFPQAFVTTKTVDEMGHCDIVQGVSAPERIWPSIRDWLGQFG